MPAQRHCDNRPDGMGENRHPVARRTEPWSRANATHDKNISRRLLILNNSPRAAIVIMVVLPP